MQSTPAVPQPSISCCPVSSGRTVRPLAARRYQTKQVTIPHRHWKSSSAASRCRTWTRRASLGRLVEPEKRACIALALWVSGLAPLLSLRSPPTSDGQEEEEEDHVWRPPAPKPAREANFEWGTGSPRECIHLVGWWGTVQLHFAGVIFRRLLDFAIDCRL